MAFCITCHYFQVTNACQTSSLCLCALLSLCALFVSLSQSLSVSLSLSLSLFPPPFVLFLCSDILSLPFCLSLQSHPHLVLALMAVISSGYLSTCLAVCFWPMDHWMLLWKILIPSEPCIFMLLALTPV